MSIINPMGLVSSIGSAQSYVLNVSFPRICVTIQHLLLLSPPSPRPSRTWPVRSGPAQSTQIPTLERSASSELLEWCRRRGETGQGLPSWDCRSKTSYEETDGFRLCFLMSIWSIQTWSSMTACKTQKLQLRGFLNVRFYVRFFVWFPVRFANLIWILFFHFLVRHFSRPIAIIYYRDFASDWLTDSL